MLLRTPHAGWDCTLMEHSGLHLTVAIPSASRADLHDTPD
jgi:hypothetical protein